MIALLEENKPAITQMVEAETERVVDAWMELYRSTFVRVMRDFDLATHALQVLADVLFSLKFLVSWRTLCNVVFIIQVCSRKA